MIIISVHSAFTCIHTYDEYVHAYACTNKIFMYKCTSYLTYLLADSMSMRARLGSRGNEDICLPNAVINPEWSIAPSVCS